MAVIGESAPLKSYTRDLQRALPPIAADVNMEDAAADAAERAIESYIDCEPEERHLRY